MRDTVAQSKPPFHAVGAFELYAIVSSLSKLGNQIFYVVIPLFVLHLTHSAFKMGIEGFCQTFAYILSPWIGQLIDGRDRRATFVAGQLLKAILLIGLPVCAAITTVPLWDIYLTTFVVQAIGVMTNTVSDYSILPALIRGGSNERWNAAFTVAANVGRLIGPVVAGLLIGLIGYLPALYVDAASLMLLMGFVLKRVPVTTEAVRRGAPRVWDGFRMLWQLRELWRYTLVFALVNLSVGALPVVCMYFMRHRWHLANPTVGLVMTLVSVSGLVGSLVAPRIATQRPLKTRFGILVAALLIAGAPVILILRDVTLAGFILTEGAVGAMQVLFTSYRQKAIANTHMGRVNSAISLTMMAGVPFASIAMADLASTAIAKVVGVFVVACAATALVLVLFRHRTNKIAESQTG